MIHVRTHLAFSVVNLSALVISILIHGAAMPKWHAEILQALNQKGYSQLVVLRESEEHAK